MQDYLAKSNRAFLPDQKKLLGVLKTKKVLLYAPLLKWYLEHGLQITAVHQTIDYIPQKIFHWFVQEVANKQRQGDAAKQKKLCSLKCSSFWATGPMVGLLKPLSVRQKCCTRKDENVVDKHLRSVWFKISKRSVTCKRSNPAETRLR